MKKLLISTFLMLPILVFGQDKDINKDINKPMEFIEVSPCSGNSIACETFLLLQGNFNKNTPQKLSNILKKTNIGKVAFDSKGGDIDAAIDVGYILAKNEIEVLLQNSPYEEEILDTSETDGEVDAEVVELSDLPQCKNECGYALLGGTLRNIEDNADFSINTINEIMKKSKKYKDAKIEDYFKKININKDLKEKLYKENKEIIFSNDDLTKYNIENYSKREFDWIVKNNSIGLKEALKSILLSEGRGRLVLSIKQEDKGFYSFEIMLKSLFDVENMADIFGDLEIKSVKTDQVVLKVKPEWIEVNGIIVAKVKISTTIMKKMNKDDELFLSVDLPHVYYSCRMDTDFLMNDILSKLN